MILHCSKKLATKLPNVSPTSLDETSPLGSWHAHLMHFDRRQCVMFMHDETRFALFLAGVRKEHFAVLGERWFRELFTATLAVMGCTDKQIRKVELVLGPVRYDTATDRSVQGSIRIAKQDLEAQVYRAPHVLDLDPVEVSRKLSHRPATIHGQWLWPDQAMLARVAAL